MKYLTALALGALLAVPIAAVAADTNDAPGKPADNTGKNVRDRNDQTLVPIDQAKGSDADVETTRNIRKTIVADDSLSRNAHNVKIVTLNGVTTLRGPVASAAEKGRLGDIAMPELEAKQYDEKIRNGNILLSVHTDDGDEQTRVTEIFTRHHATDISSTSEKRVPKAS